MRSPFDAIACVLLSAAFAARQEFVLTTPYFVPGEAMLAALTSAKSKDPPMCLASAGAIHRGEFSLSWCDNGPVPWRNDTRQRKVQPATGPLEDQPV